MLPDRVSNPGPLTYESGVLPIALRGPAHQCRPIAVRISSFSVTYLLSVLKAPLREVANFRTKYFVLISVDLTKYEIFRPKVCNFWQGCFKN